ncbi:hypothetical protein L1987_83601 [Smallanthus sonchifolius]|uniref:Uncharacterized protein n=1 Tax=Smallanthus sonchifolius TaxID=185202 RepID=A0ACB8YCG4_9ASTR|nr:hypothetical protein L1987_83601 [Smallanthus sonchifolius]
MTRSASSIIVETIEDFTDQWILDHFDLELCSFTDSEIKNFEVKQCFPQKTIFWPFDYRTKADLISKTWICFHYYPFTLGLSYPFPPLTTEFFKLTGRCYSQIMPMVWRILISLERLNRSHSLTIGIPELSDTYNLRTNAPKFCEPVPARNDTDKMIEALLEIPMGERSFRLESCASQASLDSQYFKSEMSSGIPKSGSQFSLSELDSLLSCNIPKLIRMQKLQIFGEDGLCRPIETT